MQFEMKKFFKEKGWAALGGLVVTCAIWLYSQPKLSLPAASVAHEAFVELKTVAAVPNEFILLGALILFMGYFVLASSPLVDLLANWGLRPALYYCLDATCLAVGVIAGLLLVSGMSEAINLAAKLCGMALFALVLHGATRTIEFYLESASVTRGKKLAIAVFALSCLALLYVLLPDMNPSLKK